MVAPARVASSLEGCIRIAGRQLAFVLCVSPYALGYGRAPEEVADQVVFADVVAEEVDAWGSEFGGGGAGGGGGGGGG